MRDVMDFAPVGIFDRKSAAAAAGSGSAIPYDTPVWWSSLFDATGPARAM
jgi:hypothetical protein